jgi:hypothetical protein
MRNHTLLIFVCVTLFALAVYADPVTYTLNDVNAMKVVDSDPVDGVGDGLQQDVYDVGIYMASGLNAHSVFAFQMTGVADPSLITDANFSVTATYLTGTFDFHVDAYAVRTSSSSDVLTSDYQNTSQLLMNSFSTRSLGLKQLDASGQSTLGTWLKNNWSDGDYAFISLQSDPLQLPKSGATRVIRFGNGGTSWAANQTDAKLDVTVIPEPASALFFIGGAAAIALIRRRLRALK